MSLVERAQKILVERHPTEYKGSVTSFGCIHGGRIFSSKEINHHVACLASLSGLTSRFPDLRCLYIWHQPKTDEEVSRRYLEFLVGKESPWRDVVYKQSPQDFSFVQKHGYVLDDFDIPSNLLVNFLTAFRYTEEKPDQAECWDRLVRDGASPGASVITCGFISSYNAKTSICTPRHGSNHYAFDSEYAERDTVDRINSGCPNEKTFLRNFSKSSVYTPCNVIWGRGESIYRRVYDYVTRHSESEFKDFNRRFSDPVQMTSTSTFHYSGLLAFAKSLDDKSFWRDI